jgi:hypothetical protein
MTGGGRVSSVVLADPSGQVEELFRLLRDGTRDMAQLVVELTGKYPELTGDEVESAIETGSCRAPGRTCTSSATGPIGLDAAGTEVVRASRTTMGCGHRAAPDRKRRAGRAVRRRQ